MVITLTRSSRRNAVDWRMRDDLVGALETALAEPSLRVVLRGSGPDFSAGGDLDEFGSRPDPARAHLIRLTRSPAMLLHRLADRTTARLHGHCLGAGIELPAFASRVVAAEDTRIALPEIGLGLIPGAGGTASLPRRIGRWRTAYLALSRDTLDADQALAWGLVDEISRSSGLALEHRACGGDDAARVCLRHLTGDEDHGPAAVDNLRGGGHVLSPAGDEADRQLDEDGRAAYMLPHDLDHGRVNHCRHRSAMHPACAIARLRPPRHLDHPNVALNPAAGDANEIEERDGGVRLGVGHQDLRGR